MKSAVDNSKLTPNSCKIDDGGRYWKEVDIFKQVNTTIRILTLVGVSSMMEA